MRRLLFDNILGQVSDCFRELGMRPPGTAHRRRVGVVEKAVALAKSRERVGKGKQTALPKNASPQGA